MHPHAVRHAEFSSDGLRILSVTDAAATVWDAETGQVRGTPIPGRNLRHAQFSPDGQYVVTVTGNTVRVWDAETGSAVSPPMRQPRTVTFASLAQQQLDCGNDRRSRRKFHRASP